MKETQMPLTEESCPRPIQNSYNAQGSIILHNGDSCEFLKTIPSESVMLIVTSPPYNVGKEYEKTQSFDSYLEDQIPVIDELIRILHPSGSLCWEVGNSVKNKEVFPLDILYYPVFKTRGLILKNRIIWHMGHGQHEKRRFSGRYETLLWFTKSHDHKFNLDAVRVPNKYPGKRYYRGNNKGKPSCNPLGKNPSDFWEIAAQDWEKEIWEIPNVKAAHPEKTIHPTQYPIELVERCVLAFTDEDDWILDPFCGVASSLIAGLKHNRKVIGVDKEEKYIQIGRDRIDAFYKGELKIRPLGKPIEVPNPNHMWAKVPEEWTRTDGQD